MEWGLSLRPLFERWDKDTEQNVNKIEQKTLPGWIVIVSLPSA